MKIKNQTFDLVAILSSILCAIHCAALPIILSVSALSGLHFLGNPLIETSFIFVALILAIVSLGTSYLKVHNSKKPSLIALMGFVFIVISRMVDSEWLEVSNTVIGALLISFAHYANWLLLKRNMHNH